MLCQELHTHIYIYILFMKSLKKKFFFLIFESWQVCDWLAKWMIMSRFMDLRWPRGFFWRSNVGLVRACLWSGSFHCLTLSTNTLTTTKNSRYIVDDISTFILLNENYCMWCFSKGPINNKPALVQIMDWRRADNKPLPFHPTLYWVCDYLSMLVLGMWLLIHADIIVHTR